MEAPFRIDRRGDRVTAVLFGAWDEPEAREFALALKANLPTSKEVDLVVDLRELTECRLLARAVLADLHTEIKGRLRRSAYVADRPRFRGMALYVGHVAEDETTKAVRNTPAAEAWLASEERRVADIRRRLEKLAKGEHPTDA